MTSATLIKPKAVTGQTALPYVDQIKNLLHKSEEEYFNPDEYIFREGDKNDHFYLIVDGEVEISKKTSSGQSKVITHLHPGEIFGEGVLSGIIEKPASARAISNTHILALSKNHFDEILITDPRKGVEFLLLVIDFLNNRINRTNTKLLALYEINKLTGIHEDDLNNLLSKLTHKMMEISDSQEGIVCLRNPFSDKYRVLYSTSDAMNEKTFEDIDKTTSRIITRDEHQYLFVTLKDHGFLALRRSKENGLYKDDQLQFFILIAEQIANIIEVALHRASKKAKNIMKQKKFVL